MKIIMNAHRGSSSNSLVSMDENIDAIGDMRKLIIIS
jgi:hypothetical protein